MRMKLYYVKTKPKTKTINVRKLDLINIRFNCNCIHKHI